MALGFSAAASSPGWSAPAWWTSWSATTSGTARAKGLQERIVILRHALKNALILAVTVLGLQFGTLLAAPSSSRRCSFAQHRAARRQGDPGEGFPIVQGVVLFTATAYVIANFLVDVSYRG